MNIFHLSECPVESAVWQHDKHVVKMVLETAQLLSQAVRLVPEWQPHFNRRDVYKVTHQHHPSSRWTRRSVPNLFWLAKHGIALSDEYSHRFWRRHKSAAIIHLVADKIGALPAVDTDDLTPFAQAMPVEFKRPDDPVAAYRAYYLAEKVHVDSNWTNRRKDLPEWLFHAALKTE